MNDSPIRSDFLRMGVLMTIIVLAIISLKIYDNKTNEIGKLGGQIYNKIFISQ